MKIQFEDIAEALTEMIEAKKLLDKILSYYRIYDGDFVIPEYEKTYDRNSLNTRIREYINFDDSE